MDQITAAITVVITHHSGPVVADPDHVRRWLCADGQNFLGTSDGFSFLVCPQCPDPDDYCDHVGMASYKAAISSADW